MNHSTRSTHAFRQVLARLALTLALTLTPAYMSAQTPFPAVLNGAQEVPSNGSSATGVGTVVLTADEQYIIVNLSWSGLAAPATAAHVHGPAGPGTNASPLFTLASVPAATSGAIPEQMFSVNAAQVDQLKRGLLYLNVHNATYSGGEIRGQLIGTPAPCLDCPAPTASSPIAITRDGRWIWVVNPDSNSVSVIDVWNDANTKVREISVGRNPRCLAITPNGDKVYVTNQRDGTVSVIDADEYRVRKVIKVGTEPVGCALTPDGKRLLVANSGSDSVFLINARSDKVQKKFENLGPKPHGIAIDLDEKVYVTHLLAQLRGNDPRPVTEKEGRDDGKEGRVTVLSAKNFKLLGTVILNPLADTGFKANGSTLDRVGAASPAVFPDVTGAFPNLLQSVVIWGHHAYLPNVGSSPNGPVRFNVNVQALLSVFTTTTHQDSGQTINLNRGVQFEPVGQRLFNTTPNALAFKPAAQSYGAEGFVVAGGIDRLVRVTVDSSGAPTIHAPTNSGDPGNIIRIAVGNNPQGIAINPAGTRAYVMNYISRDVSVVDISGIDPLAYHEMARVQSVGFPAPGSLAAIVHRGNLLFNTSIGPAGTNENALAPAGRMSDFGWGNCYNCHPNGLHDGVTWMFGDGPRQTISMEGAAEHPQPGGGLHLNGNGAPLLPDFKQRVLNWSAVRDEIQDFELNIRGVSGGQGLIRDGAAVFNLIPTANTGRDADLDALAAYVAFGIQAPISPRQSPTGVAKGRRMFERANCQDCHGGPNWTRSRVTYTPPPDTNVITVVNGQLTQFLVDVGTFDPNAYNEVRPSGTNIVTANGALGFNPPSLLSVGAGAPYLHSGGARTLEEVLDNVTHRSAGTGGRDDLGRPGDRKALIKFLKSIDGSTVPFP